MGVWLWKANFDNDQGKPDIPNLHDFAVQSDWANDETSTIPGTT